LGKADFSITSEPRGERAQTGKTLSFLIQKHAATRLHHGLRLELDRVLMSWAVPRGPSNDPAEKRMAIHVENDPCPIAPLRKPSRPSNITPNRLCDQDRVDMR
jgi:bifunctional non-homologous end joining protein LigD